MVSSRALQGTLTDLYIYSANCVLVAPYSRCISNLTTAETPSCGHAASTKPDRIGPPAHGPVCHVIPWATRAVMNNGTPEAAQAAFPLACPISLPIGHFYTRLKTPTPLLATYATSSTRRTVETDVCSSQSVQGSAHGGEQLLLPTLLGAPTNATMPSPGSVTPHMVHWLACWCHLDPGPSIRFFAFQFLYSNFSSLSGYLPYIFIHPALAASKWGPACTRVNHE